MAWYRANQKGYLNARNGEPGREIMQGEKFEWDGPKGKWMDPCKKNEPDMVAPPEGSGDPRTNVELLRARPPFPMGALTPDEGKRPPAGEGPDTPVVREE